MVKQEKYLLDTNVIIEVLRGNSEMITKTRENQRKVMRVKG